MSTQPASRYTDKDASIWFNADPSLLWEEKVISPWLSFYPEWHKKAKCVGEDDKTFFGHGDFDSRPALTPTELRKAQDICFFCPVFSDCLTHAILNREKYGVWAGTSRRTRTKAWNLIDSGKMTISEIVIQFCEARDELIRRRYG